MKLSNSSSISILDFKFNSTFFCSEIISLYLFDNEEIKLKKELGKGANALESRLIDKLSSLADEFALALQKLEADTNKYNSAWSNLQKAKYCQKTLLKDMAELRSASDQMELIVGKDFGAFPTYEDILYSVKY